MRNSIGWKFVSLPRDHQKEAKLKWHLVKGKWFAKKEKKKAKTLDNDFMFHSNISLPVQFKMKDSFVFTSF